MSTTKQVTRRTILESVKAKYTTANLSVCPMTNACVYQNSAGFTCAFGMFCMDPAAMTSKGLPSIGELSNHHDTYLRSAYRGHSEEFWDNVQELHDDKDNWDSDGLSDEGLAIYNELIKEWGEK